MANWSRNSHRKPGSAEENAWISDVLQEHGDRAWTLALAIVGQFQDAEDVLQESFLKLLRNDKKEPIRKPWAYLNAVVRTTALDVLASRQADKSIAATLNCQPNRQQTDPSEAMQGQEFSVQLDGAIAQLPRRLARVIIGRDLCQQSYAQIAEEMAISPTTARVYHWRAIRELQRILCRD